MTEGNCEPRDLSSEVAKAKCTPQVSKPPKASVHSVPCQCQKTRRPWRCRCHTRLHAAPWAPPPPRARTPPSRASPDRTAPPAARTAVQAAVQCRQYSTIQVSGSTGGSAVHAVHCDAGGRDGSPRNGPALHVAAVWDHELCSVLDCKSLGANAVRTTYSVQQQPQALQSGKSRHKVKPEGSSCSTAWTST